jgi:signal transduction histidine kinase
MNDTETSRIGPSDALDLSSTNKIRFTELQREFGERLRQLKIADGFAVYSRCWNEQHLFVPRSIVPTDFPQLLTDPRDSSEGDVDQLVVQFDAHNVIGLYANNEPPACVLYLRRRQYPPLTPSERALIRRCFSRAYCTLLAIKRAEVRARILTAVQGDSLSRLSDRSLTVIKTTLLAYETATIFFRHQHGLPFIESLGTVHGLRMPTMTGVLKTVKERTRLPLTAQVAEVMRFGMVRVIEQMEQPWLPAAYDDNVKGRISNVVYAPLLLQRELLKRGTEKHRKKASDADYWQPVGVLRITNLLASGEHAHQVRRATWEDLYLLEFVAEILFVISRPIMESGRWDNELERAVHGFQYLIRGAAQNAEHVNRAITGGAEEFQYRPLLLAEQPGSFYTVPRVQNYLSDCLRFLEDMEFQLEKVTRGHLQEKKDQLIVSLHRDVLMVALENAKRAVKIYGRRAIRFNNLLDAGSAAISGVTGNATAYVAVFRNLFENTLKYAAASEKEPRIDITFDIRSEKKLVVIVRDYGMGIEITERSYLFIEGFRGSAAIARGTSGSGIGLSYSREIMRHYGGDLELGPDPTDKLGGVVFKVTFPRARVRG